MLEKFGLPDGLVRGVDGTCPVNNASQFQGSLEGAVLHNGACNAPRFRLLAVLLNDSDQFVFREVIHPIRRHWFLCLLCQSAYPADLLLRKKTPLSAVSTCMEETPRSISIPCTDFHPQRAICSLMVTYEALRRIARSPNDDSFLTGQGQGLRIYIQAKKLAKGSAGRQNPGSMAACAYGGRPRRAQDFADLRTQSFPGRAQADGKGSCWSGSSYRQIECAEFLGIRFKIL